MTTEQMDLFGAPPQERRVPIVARADPPNSHVAARLVEPRRDSNKGRVLEYLRRNRGRWVFGHELSTPSVGGTEGLRRLRELRQGGLAVEERPSPDGKGSWQYRIAEG